MADFGLYSLRIALVVAVVGMGAGIFAGVRNHAGADRVARRSAGILGVLVTLSIVALFWAFASNDFRIEYVAAHSARSMPLHYRLAALWGGQSGSLLLWLWLLCLYGGAAIAVHRSSSRRLMPWVIAMLSANAIFFLVLLNFITNPFDRVAPGFLQSDGNGLNPLLQHPVMMIHPLVLYTGFVGFAVPFSFGFAALATGDLGSAWLRTTRRWTLFPWIFLSIGILLGGRWAYEVLGWGGYWAWDPVENASFMPWLPATAYLHSVMIQEKRDMLKTWNLVLVGLTYSLCLFGTFLTRSGIVSSVHSFTNSGWFGYVFLAYVLIIAFAFFGLLLWRRRPADSPLRSARKLESALSREGGFLVNNWLFMVILVVVFWGTMFPVFSEALIDRKITVGPAFFNAVSAPFGLMLLFLTGVGPLIAWRRATWASLRRQFWMPAAVGVATLIALLAVLGPGGGWVALATWSISAFVVMTLVQEYALAIGARMRRLGEGPVEAFGTLLRRNQRRYGGYIVHLGVVFVFIGLAGAAYNEETLQSIKPGGAITLSDYRLEYLTAKPISAQHYGGAQARLALYRDDEPLAIMTPERRMYWHEEQPASIPAIHSTMGEDLYVILTAVEADGSATLKLHRNPLVNWIWLGGFTFVLGTVAVMWPHPTPGGASETSA
ncbi:MAG: heme lyase CcmF/NrfE family subunit [Deltaproteobacteria bacterium]|nr:heme lyase CcmF/NrfE family subunit [Deltaproteobacteria bacterium]MBW2445746.1 heme lyase CcmF/NrfE family subunit [Deltaproteobacteria bacterium]